MIDRNPMNPFVERPCLVERHCDRSAHPVSEPVVCGGAVAWFVDAYHVGIGYHVSQHGFEAACLGFAYALQSAVSARRANHQCARSVCWSNRGIDH